MTGATDGLTSWAVCWRLARRDGVTIGLTSTDRDLTIAGLTYRAAPGMVPSAIELDEGGRDGSLEVAGALTADGIGAADLIAGRWDGAAVEVFMADWMVPEASAVPLASGTIGAVALTAGRFEADLRGPAAGLGGAANETTSPSCRATLGDRRCRVPMAGRRRIARVVAGAAATLTIDAPEPRANAHGDGRLRWLTGANSGLESAVLASAGAVLTLREPPPCDPRPGDRIELSEGCDRTLATCAGRFANAANFQGEPFLPGIDLLTRYPGA